MKTLKSVCMAMLVMTGAAVDVGAQSPRTDINPALIYGRAFLTAPNFSPEDAHFLYDNNWQGQKLPERFSELMSQYDSQMELVCQAARSTAPCDWGIDMTEGPMTLLPHLSRAKAVVVATRLRVPWHLQNGRQSQACDELLAAFTLGRNVASDGTMISSLVRMAIENILSSSIAANFGQFSPETLKRLADGLNAAPGRQTVAACMPTEKAFFFDWTQHKILELQKKYAGNDAKVMEEIHQFLAFDSPDKEDTNFWPHLTQVSGGTSEGVLKLVRDRNQVYDKVVAFLNLPYAEFESQVKTFTEEMEKSQNPFVTKTIPSFIKARQREFRTLATLALVRAAVEYKLHGEEGLKRVNDPCGKGPFSFERFKFEGVDRGFELKSAFNLGKDQAVLIFVEKEGPPFQVDGNFPGRPIPMVAPQK
jgi:hypothetical protein